MIGTAEIVANGAEAPRKKSDLVIVYHRQPYEEVEIDGQLALREHSSPNGIVPTLKSFFGRVDHAAWVAWKLAEDPANPGFDRIVDIEDSFGSYTVARLPLTAEQVNSFYHITSKEAFWPILHSFKDRYNYDPVDWPTFREVNWAFAEAAAQQVADRAVVWIHDYNLWLVPSYLRTLKPNVRIAFFHHTPFPESGMFNVLPWRDEIIESLLACDAVGFHIPRYAANFVAVARSLKELRVVHEQSTPDHFSPRGMALSERVTPARLEYQGRSVVLDCCPVGVNVEYIRSVAAAEDTQAQLADIRTGLGGSQMILSVSRTDYTKGNIEQLQAYERLLERRPDLHGKVRLMHVSVGANRSMTAYEEVQRGIEEVSGRINGRFGSFEWQPVALISTAIPLRELIAYYQAADVAWITPLADGLNLVASEFCAARIDGDGVLVLSEFAGAAVLLAGSIPVNPYSNGAMDHAIEQALSMEPEERHARMSALQARVRQFDIAAWANHQMELFQALA